MQIYDQGSRTRTLHTEQYRTIQNSTVQDHSRTTSSIPGTCQGQNRTIPGPEHYRTEQNNTEQYIPGPFQEQSHKQNYDQGAYVPTSRITTRELAGWLAGGISWLASWLAGGLAGWLAEAQKGLERLREAQRGTEAERG